MPAIYVSSTTSVGIPWPLKLIDYGDVTISDPLSDWQFASYTELSAVSGNLVKPLQKMLFLDIYSSDTGFTGAFINTFSKPWYWWNGSQWQTTDYLSPFQHAGDVGANVSQCLIYPYAEAETAPNLIYVVDEQDSTLDELSVTSGWLPYSCEQSSSITITRTKTDSWTLNGTPYTIVTGAPTVQVSLKYTVDGEAANRLIPILNTIAQGPGTAIVYDTALSPHKVNLLGSGDNLTRTGVDTYTFTVSGRKVE